MRTYKIYVDMSSRNIYSENGAELTAETAPYSSYKEKIQLWIQYLNSATLTDVYTGFANLTVASSATVDNNMNQYDVGALNASKTGAITSIAVKSLEAVPRLKSGEIQLINSAGQNETVAFTNYTVSSGVYTFTVSDTLTYSYSADDEVRVKETPIMKTENADIDSTGKATGLFKVTLDGLTSTFEQLVEGNSQIAGCYFEHQVFETSDPDRPICTALMPFRCFGILDNGGVIPPASSSTFYTKVQVDALLLAAKEFQFSIDGSTLWHSTQVEADRFYQERYPGGEWSVAIALVVGPKGEDGSGAVESVNGETGTVVLTTADIADSSDKRYCTDAQKTVIGNTSNTNTGDETQSTIKTKLGAAATGADGYLTSTDWNTFNGKQAALGFTPVANSGNETIAGIKTFSSSPIVPTPTTDMQAATKKYVDDNIGGGGSTSDTDRGDGTAWTSTTSSPSQRASEKALNQVAIEPAKRVDLLTASDHGKLAVVDSDNGIDAYTKLMLHLDGDTIDASPSAHTITNSGTTSDTSNKVFGSASRAFASGNYLSIPASSDFALDGDFTFDFRIKTAGTGSIQSLFINQSSTVFQISIDYSGHLQCYYIDGTILVSSGTVTNDAWHHVSVVRSGSAFKFYIDGTNDGSVTESRSISTPTQPVIIGVNPSASQNFVGNIDEFRFSKGIARWTSNFTPPTAAYSPSKFTLSTVKDTDVVTTLTQGGSTGIDVISKSGNTLTSKKIKAGTNVTVSESGNEIAIAASGGSGSGDVVGPSSATNNALARFDGETGKIIKNSGISVDDAGVVSVPNSITVSAYTTPGTLLMEEKSGLGSPAADKIYLYAADKSSTTTLYTKDSSGNVHEILNDLTGLANPMTASGDIIYGGTSGVATRLAKGSDGQVLKLASGIPSWAAEFALVKTCDGRLTLESGVAISTTDQTAKTTLYFTPYNGNQIALYSGSAWVVSSFTERSLSLSGLTANTNYDIFIYDNSGTLTLESVAWTDSTTRATALTTQDGIYVKSGATTRRYLGTIRTTATTGQCEIVFSSTSRTASVGIWNMYNRVPITLYKSETTSSWTYNSTSWRYLNNSDTNRINIIMGILDHIDAGSFGFVYKSGTVLGEISIGVDSTSAATVNGGVLGSTSSTYFGVNSTLGKDLVAGFHYIAAIERATGADTVSFLGSGSTGFEAQVTGIKATIKY